MLIAKEYGQPPHEVAQWDQEWLAAAVTVMTARTAAEAEIQKRAERRRKMAKRPGA